MMRSSSDRPFLHAARWVRAIPVCFLILAVLVLRLGTATQFQPGHTSFVSVAVVSEAPIKGPYSSRLGTDFHELARLPGIETGMVKIAPRPKAPEVTKVFGVVPGEPPAAAVATDRRFDAMPVVVCPAERWTAFEARAPPPYIAA